MKNTKQMNAAPKVINTTALVIFSILFICLISGDLFGLSRAVGGFLRGTFGLSSYGLLIGGIVVCSLALSGRKVTVRPSYLITFSLLYFAIILFVHTLSTRLYIGATTSYAQYLSLCYDYSFYPSFGGLFAGLFVYPVSTTSFVLACLLFVSLICLLCIFSAQRISDISEEAPARRRSVARQNTNSSLVDQENEQDIGVADVSVAQTERRQKGATVSGSSERDRQIQQSMEKLYGKDDEEEDEDDQYQHQQQSDTSYGHAPTPTPTSTPTPKRETAPEIVTAPTSLFDQESEVEEKKSQPAMPPRIVVKPRSMDELYKKTNDGGILDAEKLADKIRSGQSEEDVPQQQSVAQSQEGQGAKSLYDSIKNIPVEEEKPKKPRHRGKVLYAEPKNQEKEEEVSIADTNTSSFDVNPDQTAKVDDIPFLHTSKQTSTNVDIVPSKQQSQSKQTDDDALFDGFESDTKTQSNIDKQIGRGDNYPDSYADLINQSQTSPVEIHLPTDDQTDETLDGFLDNLSDEPEDLSAAFTTDKSDITTDTKVDTKKDIGDKETVKNPSDNKQEDLTLPQQQMEAFGEKKVEFGGKTGFQGTILEVSSGIGRTPKPLFRYGKYNPPSYDLLKERAMGKKTTEQEDQEVATMLEDFLREFKVEATVENIIKGPTVTRYELKMGQGISVKRVQSIADDIAMRMSAATSVRIEVPIPGKDLFGIEVPNKKTSMVGLRNMIESDEFYSSKGGLHFALGINISGDKLIGNLADMPHLLIAGATGAGKSVCLNCLIVSLMYKYSPEQLRFILVDPKQVEFFVYEKSPHLLVPQIITQPEHCLSAMSWLVDEMESRYTLFKNMSVRDIDGYNAEIDRRSTQHMQRIVLIIDELNDLMNKEYKAELETRIKALSQKARAAGIHLVFATQRPSVDVLTGTIKANFPSRIGLKVSSIHDSKTVLDVGGAEKLVGRGDMLYRSPLASKPERLQAAFVELSEVDNVIQYITDNNLSFYDDAIKTKILTVKKNGKNGSSPDDEENLDPLFVSALKYCIEQDTASITMLQRVFEIGYNRAGRLIEAMTSKNFITPYDGAKSRKIIITMDEFMGIYGDFLD